MSQARPARAPCVKQIGEHLRDVPWKQRQAMLEDVSTHLDGAGLPPDDLASWNERFGSPRDYALQLRSDLGLRTDPKSLGRARIRHVRHVRLRTKLLIGLAFLVSGATSAGVLWVRNLQPFRFDNL